MIYQLEIDDSDETAKAVLTFLHQLAETNSAIKPPVAISDERDESDLTEHPFGTMKGSFQLSPDFNESLDAPATKPETEGGNLSFTKKPDGKPKVKQGTGRHIAWMSDTLFDDDLK